MMSAIGWEANLISSSKIAHAGSKASIEWYAECILQGCNAFRTNMKTALKKAMDATESLPDLEGNRALLEKNLTQWHRVLR